MMDMPPSTAAVLVFMLLAACSDKAATLQSFPTKPKTWACSFDQPAQTITTAELKTTPLHEAVYDLHEGMAARLLKTVSANVRNGMGQTPIFGVVRGPIPDPKDMASDPVLYKQKNIKEATSRLRLTKLLIAAHADVNVQDNAGTTALMHGLVGYGRLEPVAFRLTCFASSIETQKQAPDTCVDHVFTFRVMFEQVCTKNQPRHSGEGRNPCLKLN
jgi:hypothetical protein